MKPEHYYRKCGCMYTKGNPYPWHICQHHFSKGLRLHDASKSLKIEPKTTGYALANLDTVDLELQPTIRARSEDPQKHYWLYALKLAEGKYYVGMTGRSNPYLRIHSHGDYLGARWTMKHLPQELLELRDIGYTTKEVAEDLEQQLTLAYMQLYGYKNVRGGRVVYTGSIFRVGKLFIRDQQIISAVMAIVLISVGLYMMQNY